MYGRRREGCNPLQEAGDGRWDNWTFGFWTLENGCTLFGRCIQRREEHAVSPHMPSEKLSPLPHSQQQDWIVIGTWSRPASSPVPHPFSAHAEATPSRCSTSPTRVYARLSQGGRVGSERLASAAPAAPLA